MPRPAWLVNRDLGDQWRKDNAGIEMVTAWGRRPAWDEVTAEAGPHGRPLFDDLAARVWAPLLAAEVE